MNNKKKPNKKLLKEGKHNYIGSDFDDFLKEEGIYEECKEEAARRVMVMATTKEIKEHLDIALKEIGIIKPWFDENVQEWVFSHPNYPVEYGGSSPKEVIQNYPKYLREFIKERLNDNLSHLTEKKTKGLGGQKLSRSKTSRNSTYKDLSDEDFKASLKRIREERHQLIKNLSKR